MKKKDQHYVPKLYLRRFSIKEKGVHLGLFNLSSDLFLPKAELRHQAYEKYFYGTDGEIENVLARVETQAIAAIRMIDKDPSCLKPNSKPHLDLLVYTILQMARTKAKAKEIEDMFDGYIRLMEEGTKEIKKMAEETKSTNPAAYSLEMTAKYLEVVLDLDFALLINASGRALISSDNPVIEYNQFLESRHHHGSITGLNVKGIQYVLPLDPLKAIIFYDNWAYKIGSRKSSLVETKETKDIDQLNLLQSLNCTANIYFNEQIPEDYVRRIVGLSARFEKPGIVRMNEYPQGSNPDGTTSSILHTFSTDLKIGLNLSFIKETKRAKRYKVGSKVVHLRNEGYMLKI